MKVTSVTPPIGLPGGIVRVELEGLANPNNVRVEMGGVEADLMGSSSQALTVRVPEGAGDGLLIRSSEECREDFKVGTLLASEFHAVSNPVVDSFGNIFVTMSGARGEKLPFGVFIVHPDGQREPFLAEITNPTSMTISPDHYLFVTSRHTGTAYRSTFDKQVEKFVDGLGVATGIVFDSSGNLLVGDRNGTIYRITPDRQISTLCELEPSVSAYHLAWGPDDFLYVTGPTLSTQDSIYRVSTDGQVETVFRGLGRPQGLAFDRENRLQVAASYRGRKGIFTLKNGTPSWTVSGPMLVGLAYNPDRTLLYLVDNSNLFKVNLN